MGLDIHVALGPLEKIAESSSAVSDDAWDAMYEDGYPFVARADYFAGREAPLENSAVYKGKRGDHFLAGSYSGYNRWREELSRFAFDREPQGVWDHPDKYAGKPFFEIVHFSDCEGCLGPEVAAKLAADFDEYEQAARTSWSQPAPWQRAGDVDWRYSMYEQFRKAFRAAADTQGAVIFS